MDGSKALCEKCSGGEELLARFVHFKFYFSYYSTQFECTNQMQHLLDDHLNSF